MFGVLLYLNRHLSEINPEFHIYCSFKVTNFLNRAELSV